MAIGIKELWIISGILLGFQFNVFYWRIHRESQAPVGVVTWISPADIVNLSSMMIMLVGVFLAPIMGVVSTPTAIKFFGLGVLLFVGHIFAMAGHYELYNKKTARTYNKATQLYAYLPRQEQIVLIILLVVIIIYLSCFSIV